MFSSPAGFLDEPHVLRARVMSTSRKTQVPQRCRAKARTRGGQPCQAALVRGKKRCRMHGGLSTGPRTPEGLERSRRARWVHGRHSRDAIEARRRANWETVEQAMARFQRESRRADRMMAKQSRALTRELDRLLGRIR
jgi:hypothetical protein